MLRYIAPPNLPKGEECQRNAIDSPPLGELEGAKFLRWLRRRGSPLPIPNREVKPACADGTAICGRVCRRLSLMKPV